jgi:hypothetical protein
MNSLQVLREQVTLACRGVRAPIDALQTSTGIKDALTQYWIDDLLARHRSMKMEGLPLSEIQRKLEQWVAENGSNIHNEHLTTRGMVIHAELLRNFFHSPSPGFDPTQDSPIELLHTILLGVVKYAWHMSHSSWSSDQKLIFATQLRGTNAFCINTPSIRAGYIMQYANSLIGRQLKIIVQTVVLHSFDLLPPDTFALWKAIGELMALLWPPAIDENLVGLHSILSHSRGLNSYIFRTV